jgi:hypothetical protein
MTAGSALWLGVIASGLYHGLSPGMGWPLAVAAALSERRTNALFRALLLLAAGHLAAMAAVVLPFGLVATLAERSGALRIGVGFLVMGFGIYRLLARGHPRALACIRPTQLALWSILVALAHGAGLLLVPVFLGLEAGAAHAGHGANLAMTDNRLGLAIAVSALHTLAMLAGSGGMAWLVYRHLGLGFLTKSWFNLDRTWALSLIAAGAASLWAALS